MKKINLLSIISIIILISYGFANAQDDKTKILITNAKCNSELNDYASIQLLESVLYVSDKTPETFFSAVDEQTGHSFQDVFTNSKDKKITGLLEKINSNYHEGPLCFTEDMNTVFFTRSAYKGKKKRYNEDGKMLLQIFYLTYENNAWSEIKEFPLNSMEYSVGHPSISSDSKTLYFVSDMKGGKGGTDIYKISYNNGQWGSHENLGEKVNSAFNEMFPFVSSEGTLYFSSNDEGGYGGMDIYFSEAEGSSFDYRKRMEKPINSDADDFSFSIIISDSGEESGMLSSNRAGGKGMDDIYYWTSNVKPLKIRGTVTDTRDKIVADAVMIVTNAIGEEFTVRTDVEGKYMFDAERNSYYNIKISHDEYFNDEFDLSSKTDDLNEFIDFDIVMEDFPVFSIKPINEDGTSISGMKISINCDDTFNYTDVSDEDGISWEFPRKYRRGDSVNLVIDFNKKGYLNRKITMNMVIEEGGEIVIPKENLVFVKAEEKLEISKIIDLNPIYYDFAKWDIREDAAVELDKVIEFLNSNPDVSIELSSHTDCRGSNRDNLILSDKRAKSAADYIKAGIENPDQIYGKGYGETSPIIDCPGCKGCEEEDHAANRRTEFTIVNVSE